MESLEHRQLRALLVASGVPHRVTAAYERTGHALGSYHGREGTDADGDPRTDDDDGLALDVAGPRPSRDADDLLRIYKALEPLGPYCAELIYAGPGGGFWKNGRKGGVFAAADHHDHVHIAVPRGWSLFAAGIGTQGGTIEVMVDNPDLPNIDGPLQISVGWDSNGVCTGYAIFSQKTGELHGFGPGWRYHGRSEDITPG